METQPTNLPISLKISVARKELTREISVAKTSTIQSIRPCIYRTNNTACIGTVHCRISQQHTNTHNMASGKRSSSAAAAAALCLLLLLAISSSCVEASRSMRDEKEEMLQHCRRYIRAALPDPFLQPQEVCCHVVRGKNVQAICDAFTPADLARISLPRWAAVTHVCGNALPVGANCAGMYI